MLHLGDGGNLHGALRELPQEVCVRESTVLFSHHHLAKCRLVNGGDYHWSSYLIADLKD
jgi:hypothetical protein